MRCFLLILGMCTAVLSAMGREVNWIEKLDTAKAEAAAQNRSMLMLFTDTDSCEPCKKLRAELDTEEFRKFADARVVLYLADMGRNRRTSPQQIEANREVAEMYGIHVDFQHAPVLVFAAPNGQVLATLPTYLNATKLVELVEGLMKARANGRLLARERPESRPPGAPIPGVSAPAPPFAGAQTQPPTVYTNLVLKSISGTPSRRFALVNGETMAAGDTARLKLVDSTVRLQCVEVRAESVLVRVQGEKDVRELKLPPSSGK